MKRSKLFLLPVSLLLCAISVFAVFSSGVFGQPTPADISINGAKGRLRDFGNGIINMFSESQTEDVTQAGEDEQKERLVMLGGYPIGLKLYADGVIVVGTEAVDTSEGNVDTAQRAGIKIGDIIKKVNGQEVTQNSEVSQIIEKSGGDELEFWIKREEKEFSVRFKSAFSVSENKYKAGIWIRDSSAGIGTVTFCTEDGWFASLGHAVCDMDTKTALPISQGESTEARITGYIKGENGTAGELCGFLENARTGCICSNEEIGVYGCFDGEPRQGEVLPVAECDDVQLGKAEIYTTVEDGIIEKYDVSVERIDKNSADNKNLIIKVTDSALIQKTGGIIQGMSGSPIVQNGRIIGAVTHVFLNDPTGGYGIFAETMLQNIDAVSTEYSNLKSAS